MVEPQQINKDKLISADLISTRKGCISKQRSSHGHGTNNRIVLCDPYTQRMRRVSGEIFMTRRVNS